MPEAPTFARYAELDWDDPLKNADPKLRPPKELVEKAKAAGARRKKLVRGEGGFFMNRSSMGPGFRVPVHHHNHDELIVVLSGGCEFDDGMGALGADDSIVIRAQTRYGFTCGPEGMEFLTIRTGESSTQI